MRTVQHSTAQQGEEAAGQDQPSTLQVRRQQGMSHAPALGPRPPTHPSTCSRP